MINQLKNYLLLMRFHKPIGILLLLWPTLWALWVAGEGKPDALIVLYFVLGVIVMRSAGCVINDFADRHFDPFVARTKQRPLATGCVSAKEAIGLFIVLISMAFILVLQFNKLTLQLAFVGALLTIIYPFTKRFTHFPQFVLGIPFAWSVPMSFAALTHTIPPIAWLLFAAAVLWPVAYDTMYAMVDKEDDLKIGLKSTAILFADYDRIFVAILQFFVLLLLFGLSVSLSLGAV